VPSYMEGLDLTVLTSISEGQPLSVLESMAAGRPCVTTDVGSCRELLLLSAAVISLGPSLLGALPPGLDGPMEGCYLCVLCIGCCVYAIANAVMLVLLYFADYRGGRLLPRRPPLSHGLLLLRVRRRRDPLPPGGVGPPLSLHQEPALHDPERAAPHPHRGRRGPVPPLRQAGLPRGARGGPASRAGARGRPRGDNGPQCLTTGP
jgi:hypothetical protein